MLSLDCLSQRKGRLQELRETMVCSICCCCPAFKKNLILSDFPSELKSDPTHGLCTACLVANGLKAKMHRPANDEFSAEWWRS